MVIAKWKFDNLFKGDAQLVAEEIYSIGETVTPQQILDKGRDPDTELHKCFEWDDSLAAEKYRLGQARDIVRFLVIEKTEEAPERPPMRLMYNLESGKGYKPTEIIFKNPDEYQKLLARAFQEFRIFQNKYKTLSEFQEIFELFDKIA